MGEAIFYPKEADGGDCVEAAFAGGAGVEEEDVFDVFLEGDVAVAGDDYVDACFRPGFEEATGGALGDFDLVGEVDAAALEVEGDFFGVLGLGRLAIVVSTDGGNGGDERELADDVALADVASVDDVIDTLEERGDAGVHVAVGVGYDA